MPIEVDPSQVSTIEVDPSMVQQARSQPVSAGQIAGSFLSGLNPFPAIGQILTNPKGVVSSQLQHMGDLQKQAHKDFAAGNYAEALQHELGGSVPILGPLASDTLDAALGPNADPRQAAANLGGLVALKSGPALVSKGAGLLGDAVEAIPTKGKAGLLFDQVGKAIGDTPVDLSKARQTALAMKDMTADGGSGLPRAARAVLKRTEQGVQVPWENSRRMASNAGRLSAGEMMNLNQPMRAKVAQLARDLAQANSDAAEQAGVGQQYRAAMAGYRNAALLDSAKQGVADFAKKSAAKTVGTGIGIGLGGLLGYPLYQKVKGLL